MLRDPQISGRAPEYLERGGGQSEIASPRHYVPPLPLCCRGASRGSPLASLATTALAMTKQKERDCFAALVPPRRDLRFAPTMTKIGRLNDDHTSNNAARGSQPPPAPPPPPNASQWWHKIPVLPAIWGRKGGWCRLQRSQWQRVCGRLNDNHTSNFATGADGIGQLSR